MDWTVRPATPADVAGIFEVRTSVHQNHLSVAELAGMGITPDAVGAMLADPCAWVAVEGDRILGFSMIDAEEACLFAVFIRPEAEGRGLGSALMAPAEAALFAQHPTIWLETAKESRAAGFYLRRGWHVVSEADGDQRFEKHR